MHDFLAFSCLKEKARSAIFAPASWKITKMSLKLKTCSQARQNPGMQEFKKTDLPIQKTRLEWFLERVWELDTEMIKSESRTEWIEFVPTFPMSRAKLIIAPNIFQDKQKYVQNLAKKCLFKTVTASEKMSIRGLKLGKSLYFVRSKFQ